MPELFDSAYSLILALISRELSHAFFICAILPGLGCHAAWAQAEQVVEIESRGQKIRALPVRPAQPTGGVILLAGGSGRLDITLYRCVMSLANDQLVRTRAAYARAGYAV